jgi:phenylalanine-4-hydroxylase
MSNRPPPEPSPFSTLALYCTEMATLDRVPLHLRQYVVEQDYAQYTEVDQSVWRFVLLQLYAHLKNAAHPAYARGLQRAGMSVDEIPRIAQMDARLREVGWGAVCADGFIPPRAFVEFQALGILPIAADIRTRQHLPYTPAPDIIHEAAGHAPILPDPDYADFLRQIGAVGQNAFSVPEDDAVYRAIYVLSEVKEDPAATPAQIAAAQRALDTALAATPTVSEAAKLARLYWWTVEYGLVGTPADYKLYGSGLLSSLGESHSCHDPRVQKLPLTAACVDVSYDITRRQPQLFVVPDFSRLREVLDEVASTMSFKVGGAAALEAARQSREPSTVEVDTGTQVIGIVDRIETGPRGEPALVTWQGRTALARAGTLLPEPAALGGDPCVLVLSGEIRVHGNVIAGGTHSPLRLTDATFWRGDQLLHRAPRCAVVCGERVVSARAGAVDPSYWPATEFSKTRVPKPRRFDVRERTLIELYELARGAWHWSLGSAAVPVFEEVYRRLSRDYPEEWLLRWNLLERLTQLSSRSDVVSALRRDLLELEVRYAYEQPIATGLRYLGLLAA